MNYTIVIRSSLHSPGATTALRYIQALVNTQHKIESVFFYGDGVYVANSNNVPNQDELDITSSWKDLAMKYDIPLTVCIAAALRRGQLDTQEATRYAKKGISISSPFELGGLGQLVEATASCDRVITF